MPQPCRLCLCALKCVRGQWCALLTCITLRKTFILWLDQSDCVVDGIPVQTPLHSGGLLVNLREVSHVPVLGFYLSLQSWVPPRPSVLRKGLEQRGEDTAVRVGKVIQFVQRIRGSQRVSQQRAAAGEQQQEENSAETTEDS